MWRWLGRLADEGHRSETIAAHWHRGHAVAYGMLILGYAGMILWHLAAAARHRRAARLLESARRAGAADVDDDQGC